MAEDMPLVLVTPDDLPHVREMLAGAERRVEQAEREVTRRQQVVNRYLYMVERLEAGETVQMRFRVPVGYEDFEESHGPV